MLITLTGATGFLGSHVLGCLLQDPDLSVVVLVRDPTDVAARRLRAAVAATGQPLPDDFSRRVQPMRATLEDPCLGMSSSQYMALAARTDVLWHMAGHIKLDGNPAELNRVNIGATRNILALADASRCQMLHTSTAYVAGARGGQHVAEAELDNVGFLTPYEESKYIAEQLVHRHAATTGLPTTILRPSVLVTDRSLPRGAPHHPLATLGAKLGRLQRMARHFLSEYAAGAPLQARIHGDPDASVNLLPIEYAAEAMTYLARTPHTSPPGTPAVFHVVHPQETAVQTILDEVTHHLPWLRMSVTSRWFVPTQLESLLVRIGEGAEAYAAVHRTYERTAFRRATSHLPDPPPVTGAYLRAALAPPPRALTSAPAHT